MAFNNPWQDDNDPWNEEKANDFNRLKKKFASFFSSNKDKQYNDNKSNFKVVIGGIVALYFLSGFFQVQPDEKGVVLRFGKWVRTVDSGLRYALPYPFEIVLKPKVTKINRVDIKSMSNDPDTGNTLTGDLNLASITFSVLWKIKEDGAEEYLFCDRNPELTVRAVAEIVMREIVGQTNFAYVQTEGRAQIQAQALKMLQSVVDEYNMGIEIVRVELRQVEPPASVIDSFRDVERAQSEQQSEINKADAYARDVKARTRGIIAEKLNNGEAQKRDIIAKAEGLTARFLSAYEQYKLSPEIVSNRMYISTLRDLYKNVRKVIIDDKLKVMPYLPIPNDVKRVTDTVKGE